MDIEKLNKSQIILLTLLVSFVTSIATGIVTVSLMQQAPPAIAETVNRVIENTIETVATSTRGQAAAAGFTQKTIVVNEADLISQAVKQVSPSIVRIYSIDQDQPLFLGLGVVVNASGTVAADIDSFGDQASATIVMQNGAKARSFVASRDPSSGLLYLTPASSTPASIVWTPVSRATSDPALGQVVIMLGNRGNPVIAQGIVTQIIPADKSAQVPETVVTNIDPSSIQLGSVIIDTGGNAVGVSTGLSRASSPSGFIPASLVGITGNH